MPVSYVLPIFHAETDSGKPLVGGKLFTYISGTTTPAVTYLDAAGTANTNPVILNARGEARVFLDNAVSYTFTLQDANGVQIWTQDGVKSSGAAADALRADLAAPGGGELVTVQVAEPGSIPRSAAYIANLRTVMPDQFGDVGTGGDDTAVFTTAIATGRNVDVDDSKTYHFSSELPVNISTLVGKNYKSQQINFNGAQIVVNGGVNFIKGVGWPFTTGTKVILNGGGARVTSTTPQTGNGIFLQECVGWQVKDFDVRGFQSGVHLYINDITHWCESNVIENTRTRDTTYGFRSTIVGGATGSSFDQTEFHGCEANLTVDGAIGYALDGFHGRTTLRSCGVFIDEDGATGTVGYRFNGTFSNAVAQIWADGGATADNTIQFGPAYTCLDEATSSMGGALTVQMPGTVGDVANYLKLPPGYGHRLKVVECTTVYGSHLYSDFVASSKRSASPGEFLHFSGQFFMARGAPNTLYKITVALPVGTTRVQHALVCPYANGIDNQALSAGQCGVFSLDAAVNPTVITLFAIPTNANGSGGTEGCNYMFDILCKMA